MTRMKAHLALNDKEIQVSIYKFYTNRNHFDYGRKVPKRRDGKIVYPVYSKHNKTTKKVYLIESKNINSGDENPKTMKQEDEREFKPKMIKVSKKDYGCSTKHRKRNDKMTSRYDESLINEYNIVFDTSTSKLSVGKNKNSLSEQHIPCRHQHYYNNSCLNTRRKSKSPCRSEITFISERTPESKVTKKSEPSAKEKYDKSAYSRLNFNRSHIIDEYLKAIKAVNLTNIKEPLKTWAKHNFGQNKNQGQKNAAVINTHKFVNIEDHLYSITHDPIRHRTFSPDRMVNEKKRGEICRTCRMLTDSVMKDEWSRDATGKHFSPLDLSANYNSKKRDNRCPVDKIKREAIQDIKTKSSKIYLVMAAKSANRAVKNNPTLKSSTRPTKRDKRQKDYQENYHQNHVRSVTVLNGKVAIDRKGSIPFFGGSFSDCMTSSGEFCTCYGKCDCDDETYDLKHGYRNKNSPITYSIQSLAVKGVDKPHLITSSDRNRSSFDVCYKGNCSCTNIKTKTAGNERVTKTAKNNSTSSDKKTRSKFGKEIMSVTQTNSYHKDYVTEFCLSKKKCKKHKNSRCFCDAKKKNTDSTETHTPSASQSLDSVNATPSGSSSSSSTGNYICDRCKTKIEPKPRNSKKVKSTKTKKSGKNMEKYPVTPCTCRINQQQIDHERMRMLGAHHRREELEVEQYRQQQQRLNDQIQRHKQQGQLLLLEQIRQQQQEQLKTLAAFKPCYCKEQITNQQMPLPMRQQISQDDIPRCAVCGINARKVSSKCYYCLKQENWVCDLCKSRGLEPNSLFQNTHFQRPPEYYDTSPPPQLTHQYRESGMNTNFINDSICIPCGQKHNQPTSNRSSNERNNRQRTNCPRYSNNRSQPTFTAQSSSFREINTDFGNKYALSSSPPLAEQQDSNIDRERKTEVSMLTGRNAGSIICLGRVHQDSLEIDKQGHHNTHRISDNSEEATFDCACENGNDENSEAYSDGSVESGICVQSVNYNSAEMQIDKGTQFVTTLNPNNCPLSKHSRILIGEVISSPDVYTVENHTSLNLFQEKNVPMVDAECACNDLNICHSFTSQHTRGCSGNKSKKTHQPCFTKTKYIFPKKPSRHLPKKGLRKNGSDSEPHSKKGIFGDLFNSLANGCTCPGHNREANKCYCPGKITPGAVIMSAIKKKFLSNNNITNNHYPNNQAVFNTIELKQFDYTNNQKKRSVCHSTSSPILLNIKEKRKRAVKRVKTDSKSLYVASAKSFFELTKSCKGRTKKTMQSAEIHQVTKSEKSIQIIKCIKTSVNSIKETDASELIVSISQEECPDVLTLLFPPKDEQNKNLSNSQVNKKQNSKKLKAKIFDSMRTLCKSHMRVWSAKNKASSCKTTSNDQRQKLRDSKSETECTVAPALVNTVFNVEAAPKPEGKMAPVEETGSAKKADLVEEAAPAAESGSAKKAELAEEAAPAAESGSAKKTDLAEEAAPTAESGSAKKADLAEEAAPTPNAPAENPKKPKTIHSCKCSKPQPRYACTCKCPPPSPQIECRCPSPPIPSRQGIRCRVGRYEDEYYNDYDRDVCGRYDLRSKHSCRRKLSGCNNQGMRCGCCICPSDKRGFVCKDCETDFRSNSFEEKDEEFDKLKQEPKYCDSKSQGSQYDRNDFEIPQRRRHSNNYGRRDNKHGRSTSGCADYCERKECVKRGNGDRVCCCPLKDAFDRKQRHSTQKYRYDMKTKDACRAQSDRSARCTYCNKRNRNYETCNASIQRGAFQTIVEDKTKSRESEVTENNLSKLNHVNVRSKVKKTTNFVNVKQVYGLQISIQLNEFEINKENCQTAEKVLDIVKNSSQELVLEKTVSLPFTKNLDDALHRNVKSGFIEYPSNKKF